MLTLFIELPIIAQAILILIAGSVFGSFLNVVIYRLPIMLNNDWRLQCQSFLDLPQDEKPKFNLLLPASTCPSCKARIKWWHNIPLVGFFLLNGKCASCSTAISIRYPLVEAFHALVWVLVYWLYSPTLTALGLMLFSSALLVLFFIDAEHKLLPDDITLPLLWAGLLFNLFTQHISIEQAIWGAVWGYLVLWILFWIFKLLTGKEGFGYGDFKLLAALGAWGGALCLPWLLLISACTGLLIALFLRLTGRIQAGDSFPFGPALVIAGWTIIVLQPWLPVWISI